MPITPFDLGYVYNMPMSFALLIKVNNTKFWAYEVVKIMFQTYQKFAKSENFCFKHYFAIFKWL